MHCPAYCGRLSQRRQMVGPSPRWTSPPNCEYIARPICSTPDYVCLKITTVFPLLFLSCASAGPSVITKFRSLHQAVHSIFVDPKLVNLKFNFDDFKFIHFANSFVTMYNSARMMKPKLSLSISAAQNATRPSLSLKSPITLKSPAALPRTPISPISAASPSSKMFSTLQVPNYAYNNSCSSKSILKKQPSSGTGVDKRIQFQVTPIVHCVTPIENPDEYYGKHMKMSREERRWTVRQ